MKIENLKLFVTSVTVKTEDGSATSFNVHSLTELMQQSYIKELDHVLNESIGLSLNDLCFTDKVKTILAYTQNNNNIEVEYFFNERQAEKYYENLIDMRDNYDDYDLYNLSKSDEEKFAAPF